MMVTTILFNQFECSWLSFLTDESYITNNAYKAQAEDEISFETGVVVTILQKSLDGWWRVRYVGGSSLSVHFSLLWKLILNLTF